MILTTPRLRLRPWRDDDRDAFAALTADPEVMRDLGGPLDRAASDAKLDLYRAAYDRDGFCRWAVESLSGEFLGYAGIMPLGADHPLGPSVEIGWRLRRHAWGHGYATEAAAAWLDHGFGVGGLDRVISTTDRDPPNLRSIAVMRRLGMVWDHDAELTEDGVTFPAVVHSITAEQWRAAQPGRTAPAT
jgi:RimJ/RimL family protein N-acetyltransferase